MTYKTKPVIEEALEHLWLSSMTPPLEQYEEYKRLVAKSANQVKREQKPLLNLTEVMMLRVLNRHAEADAITAKRKVQFNGIKNKIYAHRWKRMQVVDEMRLGDTSATLGKAKALAVEAATNNWVEEELRALFLQHLIEMHSGQFKPALETAQQVKLLAQKNNHAYYTLQSAWAVAHVYFFFGYYEKALEECLAVKKLFDENDLSKPQHLTFFNLLANCYQTQKQLGVAIKIYERILQYLNKPEAADSLIYIAAASNLATALEEKGRLKEAEETYRDVDAFAQKTGWPTYRLDSQLNLARLYLKQKRLKEMKACVTTAEKLAGEIKILRLEVCVLELRAQYEKAAGNTAQALICYDKYFNKYREWQTIEGTEKLQGLEMKYELQVKKLNEVVMKKEIQLQEQEVQMLNSHLQQKDKLIAQFTSYFTELEDTNLRRKEIFMRLRDMVRTIKTTQQTEAGNYSAKFNEAHRQMCEKLVRLYPAISAKEADTAVMLLQGLNNKEIATLTLTTVRNIEKHRLNLRKKMKIDTGKDLTRILGVKLL